MTSQQIAHTHTQTHIRNSWSVYKETKVTVLFAAAVGCGGLVILLSSTPMNMNDSGALVQTEWAETIWIGRLDVFRYQKANKQKKYLCIYRTFMDVDIQGKQCPFDCYSVCITRPLFLRGGRVVPFARLNSFFFTCRVFRNLSPSPLFFVFTPLPPFFFRIQSIGF